MGKYIELMKNFLTEDGLYYKICTNTNDTVYLRLPYTAKNCDFDIVCDACDKQDLVMIFIYPTINIKKQDISRIAELVCRINQSSSIGFFDFDVDDFTIRFKSTIDVEGGELTFKMFINMLHCAILKMDQCFPAFMAVLYGEHSPEMAFKKYVLDDTTVEDEATPPDTENKALH